MGSPFTKSQRHFIELLASDPKRRFFSSREIIALTDYADQVWSKALRDKDFAAYLQEVGLYFPYFSDSQRGLLRVCSDKTNWPLSPHKLLAQIGLRSDNLKAWRRALSDPLFSTELQKTNYPTWLNQCQRSLYKVLLDPATHTLSSLELAERVGLATKSAFSANTTDQRFRWFIENETDFCFWMPHYQRILYHFLKSPEGRTLFMTKGDKAVLKATGIGARGLASFKQDERIALKLAHSRVYLGFRPVALKILSSLERPGHQLFRIIDIAVETGLHVSTVLNALNDPDFSEILAKDCDYHTWMTHGQRRIYCSLRADPALEPAALKSHLERNHISLTTWHAAFKNEQFAACCQVLGFHQSLANESLTRVADGTPKRNFPKHHEVHFIADEIARLEYMERESCWDMRKLFESYPRHAAPSTFIVDFQVVRDAGLRGEAKRYLGSLLQSSAPATFSRALQQIALFSNLVSRHFPQIHSFSRIDRDITAAAISPTLELKPVQRAIARMRDVFYLLEQEGAFEPDDNALELGRLAHRSSRKPRPASIEIMQAVDSFIQEALIPKLEADEFSSEEEPERWEAFLILRYTGMRPISLLHMLATGEQRALQVDETGAPLLFIPKEYAKTKADARVPLEHLDSVSEFGNPVVRAMLRQIQRVSTKPLAPDGKPYLFRRVGSRSTAHDVPSSQWLREAVKAVGKIICPAGEPAMLLPIIMRHTLVTEMGEAGIHIERIAQFVSHESVASTEFYYGVGSPGRVHAKGQLPESVAGAVLAEAPSRPDLDNVTSAKRALLAVHEYPDAVCQNPVHSALCCALSCLVCPRKELTPDQLPAVENIISDNRINLENARRFSLTEKMLQYQKIVKFHETALIFLKQGKTFRAAEHFYHEGKSCDG